ncbi:MAG: GatB/YqeY domain-containing protein [Burkholderiales bacterium]
MALKQRITEDMKSAMRAKDSARLSAIRLLLAAIKQREVDERIELDDGQVIGVVEKLLKQRRDSIVQFNAGGRQDLVDAEQFEVSVLEQYLPAQLSKAEISEHVVQAIGAVAAVGVKDMGKVMALLKSRLAGRADMGKVSALVKTALGG